jgi:hypothetical protein
MAQEDWEIVRFPAIAEEDEIWALDTELGQYLFTRQRGEALHPERQPLATLDKIRRTIGEYNFAGQYQQMPSPQGGGMVKAAWFRSYAANEQPDKFDQIVQSWDTANKASELSDFSVCTSWGTKGKDQELAALLHVRCTGIQSTQWCCGADPSNPARIWNEVRRWDSTTYNFFHAHSNWPAQ